MNLDETTDGVSADQLDQLLERCLEDYLARAPLPSTTHLIELLPDTNETTQRFLLVELIKLEMATLVESDPAHVPSVQSYIDAFSQLLSPEQVPLDLVIEEIQLRREAGQSIDAKEYWQRFPQHKSMLSELLESPSASQSVATSAATGKGNKPEFLVGDQVDDFIIVQTLGSGAFANVYLAKQVSMARLVALKVSRSSDAEPQALAQFDHLNIVRVYDQRQLDAPPVHLLYMQFQPGGTLAEVVSRVRHTPRDERNGSMMLGAVDHALLQTAQVVPEHSAVRDELRAMSWPMAVAWIGIQLARALQTAHSHDVLHRDVKPANVLLSTEGVPKLADFNVSFAGAAGRAGAASQFGGSIGYMAPEHLRAICASVLSQPETVDHRADLYSLAILLWELWQGKRPFDVRNTADSWTQAVADQLDGRNRPLLTPTPADDALSRLLEAILRDALAFEASDRIGSGAELEARLVLAMHPRAARVFDPEPTTWQGWLGRQSTWLVASALILIPNSIAGAYGFVYNRFYTLIALCEKFPEIEATFLVLSTTVNLITFPLAVLLVVWFTRRVVQALTRSESGEAIQPGDLFATIELAHRAAIIGGVLWCIAAVVYPTVLSICHEQFTRREFSHFFLSHVICGGVAAIYPFFGITVYALTVLYPRLVRSTLHDDDFDERVQLITRRSEGYLQLACLVPLLGATLLLITDMDQAKQVMLLAIAATGVGLFAAFSAYRYITQLCRDLAPVLSGKSAQL